MHHNVIFSTLFSTFHLVMKHCFSCLMYNNPILNHNCGVPSWKYELMVEIIVGKVCHNNGRVPFMVMGTCQPHILSSLLLHVLQSFTQAFQSKIEEENMTHLGWCHLCKNDYLSFFSFRGFSVIIFLNLMLAFVEKPSSFTWVPKKAL